MALISPPATLPIRQIEWTLKQPHQVNRSGWTGRRQVLTTPGAAWWSCKVEMIPVTGQGAAKKWRAFFASLEGQVHKFPVVAVEAAQHGGVNPTIASGAAGATTVTLSASPPALVAGDFMSIRLTDGTWQLVVLTAPISGTTATFLPALRANPSIGFTNSPETVRPFAHVSLVDDSTRFTVEAGQLYSFAFDAEESF